MPTPKTNGREIKPTDTNFSKNYLSNTGDPTQQNQNSYFDRN